MKGPGPAFRDAPLWQQAPDGLPDRLLSGARLFTARRGQIVVATGMPSDDVYIVVSGLLRVTLFPSNGREILIRDLGEASLFGELAAIDGQPRSTTVVAAATSSLAIVPAVAFRSAVSETAAAALWFARHLTRQVRDLTDRVFELSALNVRTRLHCQLMRMCVEAGVTDNQAAIDPAPTHDMLARLIGSQREAVSREFGYLTSIGMLRRDKRRLTVRDFNRLTSIVQQATGSDDDSWRAAR